MTGEPHNRDEDGRFAPGNAIWHERTIHGRPTMFEDSESLWTACREYFNWATDNPLYSDTLVSFQGTSKHEAVAQMRAFTLKALCLYLRISDETWRTWRGERDDLKSVIKTVDDIIYTQKFEGAAAGLLNANLISRELGLADRQELTGRDGSPIETRDISLIETARRLAFILTAATHEQDKSPNPKETA